jgi:hypothetical protein
MSERGCTFRGKVIAVGETENVSKNPDKPFYKRQIVVDDSGEGAKFTNPVPFESTGDKCQYLDRYKVGDEVEITFYPNGRAWIDPKTQKPRYFTSNRIGYIALASEVATDGGGNADSAGGAAEQDDDDMPF